MNTIKSLVMGSAAVLAAVGSAQAADLPVKAKAVEYVKVCSLYGAGFYYIPGTDTCIRIGGYVRADIAYNAGASDDPFYSGVNAANSRLKNDYVTRGRLKLNIDTRTATDYGVVRTFAVFAPQFTTGTDTQANGGQKVEAAFIQFAGFTFGRSNSAYALPWNGYPGNNLGEGLFGGPNYDSSVSNAQYTFEFGNGLSASLGVDAQEQVNRSQIVNLQGGLTPTGTNVTAGPITTPGTNGFYRASNAVDVVGNIKFDQAWGLVQLSAAAHEINSVYYGAAGTAETAGHPDDKWGFAVTGGLQLKNLPTGPGDDLKISGTYTQGALRYLFGESGGLTQNFAIFSGGGGGAYNNLAVATLSDALYTGASSSAAGHTGLILTTGYGFNAGFNHNWNKNWSTSVFGSWSHVDYNDQASNLYCTAYRANAGTASLNCNPDFTVEQIGLQQVWRPVKDLAFTAEARWINVSSGVTGISGANFAPGGTKPTATYNLKDQDIFSGIFRVQRNF